jgi:rubrerythrin
MTKTIRTLAVTAVAIATLTLAGVPTASAGTDTLANLQAAYNGESNAHAKYLIYAERADAEGYGAVASLFRAAAHAEEIHANNHAKVIRSMGAEPEATIETPEVGTTAENLAAAIEGETYERDTMYPEFLAAARAEGNRDAMQTFNYAKTAEAEHAKYYAEALANLESLAGSDAVTYWVCSVCGYTTTTIDFTKCPSCFESKDNYTSVA